KPRRHPVIPGHRFQNYCVTSWRLLMEVDSWSCKVPLRSFGPAPPRLGIACKFGTAFDTCVGNLGHCPGYTLGSREALEAELAAEPRDYSEVIVKRLALVPDRPVMHVAAPGLVPTVAELATSAARGAW